MIIQKSSVLILFPHPSQIITALNIFSYICKKHGIAI